jgi:membrane protein
MKVFSRLWRGLQALAAAWSDDRCARRAAALSYYTAFSIAPILVIVLAVAGLIVETTTLSSAVIDQARMLRWATPAPSCSRPAGGEPQRRAAGSAAASAFAVLLVGATTAFAELKDSLDEAVRAPGPVPEGLWGCCRRGCCRSGSSNLCPRFPAALSLAVNAALAVLSSYLFGDGSAGRCARSPGSRRWWW